VNNIPFHQDIYAPLSLLYAPDVVKLSKKLAVLAHRDANGVIHEDFVDWVEKWQCKALQLDSRLRCENWCVTGCDYCWYHLKHYFNLELKQTTLTQDDGRRYPELGVFDR
jgi:hypothetical protein